MYPKTSNSTEVNMTLLAKYTSKAYGEYIRKRVENSPLKNDLLKMQIEKSLKEQNERLRSIKNKSKNLNIVRGIH